MISLGKLAAFGSAAIGTAAAASVAWVAISQGPQTGRSKQPAGKPAAGDDKVIVCVASDSLLRAGTGNVCPAGQTQLALASAPTSSESTPPSHRLDDRLADLAQRLGNLQKSPVFTVVDNDDNPIFAVRPGRVAVYYPTAGTLKNSGRKRVPSERVRDANATEAAAVVTSGEGGIFTARSAEGGLRVNVGASVARTGAWIEERGVTHLELGQTSTGTYAFKVRSIVDPGDPIAAIGESRAGTGALIIGNANGQLKTSMTIADGKGMLTLFNKKRAEILSLTEGATGGGLLAIRDADGTPMVKMGVNEGRYGIVLAGPVAGFPLVPSSGLPGSYFLGCTGGGACRP